MQLQVLHHFWRQRPFRSLDMGKKRNAVAVTTQSGGSRLTSSSICESCCPGSHLAVEFIGSSFLDLLSLKVVEMLAKTLTFSVMPGVSVLSRIAQI